jgi:ADP-ribosylation factor GTPase-activating protein 2/3
VLGYEREVAAANVATPLNSFTPAAASTPSITSSASSTTAAKSKAAPAATTPTYVRLGFGALPSAQPASASSSGGGALNPGINKAVAADSPDEPRVAREKFGAQKAISSDMYFGRGAYDAAAVEEAQGRLKAFEGRTGIGSDEYFGREEWVSLLLALFLPLY